MTSVFSEDCIGYMKQYFRYEFSLYVAAWLAATAVVYVLEVLV